MSPSFPAYCPFGSWSEFQRRPRGMIMEIDRCAPSRAGTTRWSSPCSVLLVHGQPDEHRISERACYRDGLAQCYVSSCEQMNLVRDRFRKRDFSSTVARCGQFSCTERFPHLRIRFRRVSGCKPAFEQCAGVVDPGGYRRWSRLPLPRQDQKPVQVGGPPIRLFPPGNGHTRSEVR